MCKILISKTNYNPQAGNFYQHASVHLAYGRVDALYPLAVYTVAPGLHIATHSKSRTHSHSAPTQPLYLPIEEQGRRESGHPHTLGGRAEDGKVGSRAGTIEQTLHDGQVASHSCCAVVCWPVVML